MSAVPGGPPRRSSVHARSPRVTRLATYRAPEHMPAGRALCPSVAAVQRELPAAYDRSGLASVEDRINRRLKSAEDGRFSVADVVRRPTTRARAAAPTACAASTSAFEVECLRPLAICLSQAVSGAITVKESQVTFASGQRRI
jgi:hypothetical protein